MTTSKPRGRPKKGKETGIEEVKKKKPYLISLTVAGKTYHGEGNTALEALCSLEIPNKITTKGILVLNGATTYQQVLQVPRVKRLFFPFARNVVAKQFELLTK